MRILPRYIHEICALWCEEHFTQRFYLGIPKSIGGIAALRKNLAKH